MYLVDLRRGQVLRPLVGGPLYDIAASPTSIVVLSAVPVLPARGEELDGGEALDAIAAGHDRVDGGIEGTQFHLALELGGSRGPVGGKVLAVTTPAMGGVKR